MITDEELQARKSLVLNHVEDHTMSQRKPDLGILVPGDPGTMLVPEDPIAAWAYLRVFRTGVPLPENSLEVVCIGHEEKDRCRSTPRTPKMRRRVVEIVKPR